MKRTDWFTAFLERPGWLQFLTWFLVVLALKHTSLLEPPVWDSAMGVFPPAIYLYQNNFDIVALLGEERWWDGGPNVHSLSLFTWILALVMTATDSAVATFFTIHVATFAAFAWALALFTRVLSSHGLAPRTVLAAAAFLLSMPIVLVQVGYLYTDIFILIFGVAAWTRWREDRPFQALLFCVLAIFIKQTALAIALCLFLAVLASARPLDARRVLMIVLLPVAVFVQRSLPGWLGAAADLSGSSWGEPSELLDSLYSRLSMVPDLTLLMGAALFSSIIWLLRRFIRERGIGFLASADRETSSQLICLAMPVVFSIAVLFKVATGMLFLPRYLVPVVPFAVGSVLLFAASVGRERVVLGLLIAAVAFSAANYRGSFYPYNQSKFSVVERSHAYRDFHDIQKKAITILEEKPAGVPAFVTKEIWYMISHPMLGYTEEPVQNVHPIYLPPHQERSLEDYPDHFALIRTNRYHGGAEMKDLVALARQDADYFVWNENIKSNGFKATIYWVRRKSGRLSDDAATPARQGIDPIEPGLSRQETNR